MGKGDKRRPEDTKAVAENWPWEDPVERKEGKLDEEPVQTETPDTEEALEQSAMSGVQEEHPEA